MGLFGVLGGKKFKLDKVKDLEKEKCLRESSDNNTEEILYFNNLNFKLAIIEVLMYELNLLEPRFDIYDFADEYKEEEIDVESCTVIEPALNFFR